MLKKTDLIKVRNRCNGIVIYTVPDLHIRREYTPDEEKEVSFEELQKLSYTTGGKAILDNYLLIENAEAVAQLLGEVEPEYYYTEAEVLELLTHGTNAQLEDCLDFADEGVIDLVKSIAVKIELNDMSKREIIFKKTGFNVSNAIAINRSSSEEAPVEESTKRRAAPIKTEATKTRKTEPPKYNVVTNK